MITKAQFISEQIEEHFFQDYAELFAHFNVKAFMESLSSYLQLNYTTEELRVAPTALAARGGIPFIRMTQPITEIATILLW